MLTVSARQRGVATVEFYIVALLALAPLCLGMLQISLLLIDNHHLDHAAFMAARAGATHQGRLPAMREEYARVLAPLFVESGSRVDSGNVAARVSAARLRALADVARFAQFEITSPQAAAQRDFQLLRDGARVIPNDSLEHRAATPGGASGLTLQQANMLRIQITHCRPLLVPFIRSLLPPLLRTLDFNPAHQRCYAAGRVPIRSRGDAPMQSDFLVAAG